MVTGSWNVSVTPNTNYFPPRVQDPEKKPVRARDQPLGWTGTRQWTAGQAGAPGHAGRHLAAAGRICRTTSPPPIGTASRCRPHRSGSL